MHGGMQKNNTKWEGDQISNPEEYAERVNSKKVKKKQEQNINKKYYQRLFRWYSLMWSMIMKVVTNSQTVQQQNFSNFKILLYNSLALEYEVLSKYGRLKNNKN